MTIDWIPLGRSDRVGAGLLLGVAFLISLSALPPPLSPAESGLRVAATLSTMTVYAIERANPDLLIFLFVIAMLSLLRRSPAARALAYGVAFLAGAIKYYPFVLFGIMVRERVRLFVPLALASLVALLLFCQIYGAQILEGLPHIAGGSPFNDMFGLKNFPRGMFRVFQDVMGSPSNALLATLLVTGLLFAMIAWRMTRLCWSSDLSAALRRLDEPRRLALLAGAWLLAGCTLAGQNVGYRGIFLLLVLPGLFAIGRDAAAGPLAKAARLAAIGIVPLMWAEAIRHWVHIAGESSVRSIAPLFDLLAWSAREVGWWFLIAFLLSIVVGFIAESPLFSVFRGNATARHPV
jgi:hypothetical protein